MIYKTFLLLLFTSSLSALTLEKLRDGNTLLKTLKGKKIGFYPGSFDPVHRGHRRFVEGVLQKGYCDYVLILPVWGQDTNKERTDIKIRLEMMDVLFGNHPKIIITFMSPLEIQQTLTKENKEIKIQNYSTVSPLDEMEFIGLIGSDVALKLSTPTTDIKAEDYRKKWLSVFMKGICIPEKHKESSTGCIMALPVSNFIIGEREGSDISPLQGFIGTRRIIAVYRDSEQALASSSVAKTTLRRNEAVNHLLDQKVISIIKRHNLYTAVTETSKSVASIEQK